MKRTKREVYTRQPLLSSKIGALNLAGYEPKVEGVSPGLRRWIAGQPCARAAMMARRRRQAPGEGGEEDPDDQGGLHLQERQLEEEQLALEDGEEEGEEKMEGPKGPPTTLTPMTPLFTPEQLKGLHEVQSQAPHLYAQVPRQSIWQPGMGNRSPEEVQKERPTFLPKEEGSVGVLPQTSTTTGTPSPALVGDHVPDDQRRGRTREPRVPEVQEPESDSDGRQPPQPREQSVVQIQGNGPGGRGLHVPRGFGQTGSPGYIMPHEERRGPMPHQGGWQVQLHPYGPGPPNPQEMMTMLAMLKQENQQLQIQQAELMDAMKYQRASLETKVHDLQRELEQQAFRTPESDEPVNRQLELTVDEPPRETDLEVERRRLYELTPMQQFEQLQSLMGRSLRRQQSEVVGGKDNERGRDLKVRELHVREEVNLRAWWHLGRRASNRKGDKGPGKAWVSQRRKPQPSSLVDLQLQMFGRNHQESAVVAWLMRCLC